MARGEQVYVMRQLMGLPGAYEHHGIDCGDGTIIHYRKVGEAEVSRTSREAFAMGQQIYTREQPLSLIANDVIERAESRLGERKYDVFFNNCEHFATWCKVGRSECEQMTTFGLRLDWLGQPQLRSLIDQTARDRSPEQALQLFQKANGNIAIALSRIRAQYQQARQTQDTWHRVAQKALDQNREDLARAALQRKVEAKKKLTQLETHLEQLIELQATLQSNQNQAQQRLAPQ
ncbi:MAG: lecithin retinol acyltransferase family protein [Cyanobacteria bacterium P01_C01_bin.73]